MHSPESIRTIPFRPVRRRWPGLLAVGLLTVAGGGALLMHQMESSLATIAAAEAAQAAAPQPVAQALAPTEPAPAASAPDAE